MEALTVINHESGPLPTQGSFAHFSSPPAKTTPKPAASKGSQSPCTLTAPPQTSQSKEGQERPHGPKVFTPQGQCWQCGSAECDHKWNDCTHPCLNCGGPGQHTPGGHKTSQCKAPAKGPHNKGFWSTGPPSTAPNHRQLPLSAGPPVSHPLVVASPLTAQPYHSDLNIFEVLSDPDQQGQGEDTLLSFIMGPCTRDAPPPNSDPADGRRSRPAIDPASPGPLKDFFTPEPPPPVLAEPLGSDDEIVPEFPLPSPPSLAPSPHTGPQPMTPTPVPIIICLTTPDCPEEPHRVQDSGHPHIFILHPSS